MSRICPQALYFIAIFLLLFPTKGVTQLNEEEIEILREKMEIYDFVAGKKALAEEVNHNFNAIITQIYTLQKRIDSLVILNKKLRNLHISRSPDSKLPIGTIIISMLPPGKMYKLTQERWVLADGRKSPGTYQQVTGKNRIPDLRGMFLRGLKEGDGRFPGHYQKDQFKQHTHRGYDYKWVSFNKGVALATTNSEPFYAIRDTITGPRGGHETRPKNVAVYYYVKVK